MSGDEHPGGPVVSTELYAWETRKLVDALREVLARPMGRMMEDVTAAMEARVRDAYLQGLRDGFVQGTVQLHERREEGSRLTLPPTGACEIRHDPEWTTGPVTVWLPPGVVAGTLYVGEEG